MNKVICDICGTSYPENAEQCPICGYSHDFKVEPLAEDEDFVLDDILMKNTNTEEGTVDEPTEAVEEQEDVAPVAAVVAAEAADETEEAEEEDEEDGGKRRPSGFLIAALVVVILALLATTGYIFAHYYLPGMRSEATEAPTVETTEATEEVTAAPTVPCTGLAMTSDSEVLLEQAGNTWLINVVVLPEDTTDEVIYLSNNLEVATVDADGTVTAVAEGSAVISVVCGDYTVECNVTCAFVEEPSVPDVEPEDEEATDSTDAESSEISDEDTTEAPTEEATEASTEEATEAPTEEATEAPTEEATEAPTEPVEGLELKLNKTDISFDRVGVYYTLKVTDGIDPKDVKWVSTNSAVCVVEDGVITITGTGMATVKATYNGQEASCVVRVSKGK